MSRLARPLLIIQAALLVAPLLLMPSMALASACCFCRIDAGTSVCLTEVANGGCSNIADTNSDLKNVSCNEIDPLNCKPVAQGGMCVGGVTSVIGYKKGEAISPEGTKIKFVSPQLNVPIPGLQFASDIRVQMGYITIPYLAQYIAAIYKYLIGISLVVASIMLVYGGFLYLAGATTHDIGKGKEVIKDSLIGLVLLFSIQTILTTLSYTGSLDLKPLQVLFITSKEQRMAEYLGTTSAEPEEVPATN